MAPSGAPELRKNTLRSSRMWLLAAGLLKIVTVLAVLGSTSLTSSSERPPSAVANISTDVPIREPLSSSFEWQTSRSGAFVFHYPSDERKLANYLGGLSRQIENRVAEDLGLDGLDEIRVFIASTHEDFHSLQPPGRKAEKWAAALAYPSEDRILLKSPRLLIGGRPRYEQIFLHEVAHIALEQAVRRAMQGDADRESITQPGPHASGIPRWLHEGYAIHVAREWSPTREVLLTRAVLRGKLIPLGRLASGFPEDEELAGLAYAQSADLVHHLIRTYGREAFHDFVIALGKGYRFGHASRKILGEDFHTVEKRWLSHLKTRYTWVPLLTSTGTLWFLATLVFLAAYVRKKVANRSKVARWAEEEPDL